MDDAERESGPAPRTEKVGLSPIFFAGGIFTFIAGGILTALFVGAAPGRMVEGAWLPCLGAGLGVGVLSTIVALLVLRPDREERGFFIVGALTLCAGLLLASFSLLHTLNRILDQSAATRHQGEVIESIIGKSSYSIVELQGLEGGLRVKVGKARQLGSPLQVTLRSGSFGWRWLEAVEPE